MSQTLYGTTDVIVGDETFTLVPTLKFVRWFELACGEGGFGKAFEKIGKMSPDFLANVIVHGARLPQREHERLAEQVWQHGVGDIFEQLIPFITALMDPNDRARKRDKPGQEIDDEDELGKIAIRKRKDPEST